MAKDKTFVPNVIDVCRNLYYIRVTPSIRRLVYYYEPDDYRFVMNGKENIPSLWLDRARQAITNYHKE